MASAKRPEAKIKDWAYEFDRSHDAATIDTWTNGFREHREFFLIYQLPGEQDLKAALRWRYAFKTLDAESGKEYTPAEIQALAEKQRWLLTSKSLGGEQIQTLLNTAIGLHARAMEELRESRWSVSVFAAILAFVGGILETFWPRYVRLTDTQLWYVFRTLRRMPVCQTKKMLVRRSPTGAIMRTLWGVPRPTGRKKICRLVGD